MGVKGAKGGASGGTIASMHEPDGGGGRRQTSFRKVLANPYALGVEGDRTGSEAAERDAAGLRRRTRFVVGARS